MRVDSGLMRQVHKDVGERLQRTQRERRQAGQPPLSGQNEQQFARKLIADVVREYAERRLAVGEAPLETDVEQELVDGVHARMYGAGRLQILLDDESIENIDINGCDEVWITRANSARHEPGEPIASSDEELIELIQTLASYAGLNSRPWDAANPQLDLKLPDGSRLSAVMGVSTRPSISIRRQRYDKPTLEDLLGNDTLTEEHVEFLRSLVKARFNVMIAGGTRAGKTTLLKAMASEIDPEERIITIEKTLELALRADRARHPNCVEFEERVANSEGQGGVSMSDLVRRTLRQNPDRVIVGETLGPEIIDLLNAMGQGNDGSFSTIHARTAREVFTRIATYAIESEAKLPTEASYRLVAGGLDFVVYISRHPVTGKRRLDSILEVNGYDEGVVLASEIFQIGEGEKADFTGTLPQRATQLRAAGWAPPGSW
jgi:pilus assembly protein CpaF